MVMEVARGERGAAPASVVFLSGDVHNSYVAEVVDARTRHGASSRIVQAVCSPIRNPMPRMVRVMMSAFARGLVRPMRFVAAHSKHVPDPAYPWRRHRRAVVRQLPRRADGPGTRPLDRLAWRRDPRR